MKETPDKVVAFGPYNHRFDIPKSWIYQVGANVILKIDFPEIFTYEVKKDDPLPTGEHIDTISREAYSEDYHGPREF